MIPARCIRRAEGLLPDDLKGMKVRPAQSTIGQLVHHARGTTCRPRRPNRRDMLERGVADAITFPWESIFLFGIDKVVKYHIEARLYDGFTYSINMKKYAALSPAQKKVMDDHCTTEWAMKLAGPWVDYDMPGSPR